MLRLIAFLSLFLTSQFAAAEGIKQIRPNAANTNYLVVNGGTGTNTGNNYGFLAAPLERLNIHIKNFANERIYFGFDPLTVGNIYLRIKDPTGAIVYGPVLLPQVTGLGFINSYTQAFNGPVQLVAGGYDALTFDPSMNGDYYMEFNLGSPTAANNTGISFDLYDITVGNRTTLTPINGRLFSMMEIHPKPITEST